MCPGLCGHRGTVTHDARTAGSRHTQPWLTTHSPGSHHAAPAHVTQPQLTSHSSDSRHAAPAHVTQPWLTSHGASRHAAPAHVTQPQLMSRRSNSHPAGPAHHARSPNSRHAAPAHVGGLCQRSYVTQPHLGPGRAGGTTSEAPVARAQKLCPLLLLGPAWSPEERARLWSGAQGVGRRPAGTAEAPPALVPHFADLGSSKRTPGTQRSCQHPSSCV